MQSEPWNHGPCTIGLIGCRSVVRLPGACGCTIRGMWGTTTKHPFSTRSTHAMSFRWVGPGNQSCGIGWQESFRPGSESALQQSSRSALFMAAARPISYLSLLFALRINNLKIWTWIKWPSVHQWYDINVLKQMKWIVSSEPECCTSVYLIKVNYCTHKKQRQRVLSKLIAYLCKNNTEQINGHPRYRDLPPAPQHTHTPAPPQITLDVHTTIFFTGHMDTNGRKLQLSILLGSCLLNLALLWS